jgi:hypothetical protein
MGQTDDNQDVNDLIFSLATQKQVDIAESLMCVEAHMTLPVVSGTQDYDLSLDALSAQTGFFRLKILSPPFTSRSWIKELDILEWDFMRRYARVSTGLPIWYIKIFESVLSFYPTPNATENWTLYFYKSPITTISKTVAPETPSSFDTAIAYDVARQLWMGKDPKRAEAMHQFYLVEILRAEEAFRGRRTEDKQITYQDV